MVVSVVSAAAPLVVLGWLAVVPPTAPGERPTIGVWYTGLALLPIAIAFALEARRSIGVKARRLVFAAGGSACFALIFLFVAVLGTLQVSPQVRYDLVPLETGLDTVALACFFLAFAPPRSLTGRWRRGEQAVYLGTVNEREPEERGWLAAEDLVSGVGRCIGSAVTVVARRRAAADDFVIGAASDPSLLGMRFMPGDGVAGRTARENMAVLASLAECEPELARRLTPYGESVLAAPLVAQGQSWGVVLAVHRRGALFPEDDLSMLAQLGRNAAISLDHAALIRERREQARQVADRRLRELESRVGVMVDSIRDYAMLVLDADGVVAAWHMGAEHVFGYTRQQITRHTAATLFDVPLDTFASWLHEAREHGLALREGVCRRFDGHSFLGETTIRPLAPEPGMPPGFVVVTHDVTERRTLEERLRQGQKMQAIGQLAGGVAHDFNNLLTAILGYADWLEQDMAGDARLDQIREIQRAAERAADLTRQLLAFSRREMIRPAIIDLTRLIQELLPMLRRLIEHPVEIVEATAPATSAILGDRSQVEQIILNLVLNARDAMPNGGRVTVRTTDVTFDGDSREAGLHGPHVLLEVSDTGVGMDAETRRRAFEPFFTTKGVGQGTGLGLATVYGIVQQMNGLIEIDSEPNRGCAFRVYLPHADRVVSPLDESTSLVWGHEQVLLVEDDDALRTYLAHVLECHGYRVIAAEGPEAALALTESLQEPLQLVISDVVMPGMSGPDLVAELHQSRPDLAALFISGHDDIHAGRVHTKETLSRLLQKPFSSTDLLIMVRQVLGTPGGDPPAGRPPTDSR
jgi:PAS domain S-box-containing protein